MIRKLLSLFKTKRKIKPLEQPITNLVSSPEDDRDYLMKAEPVEELPSKKILSPSPFKVKDQGRAGSCASHSLCTAMEGIMEKPLPLSERFHYYIVRQEDYMGTFPGDSGQYIRTGLKAAAKQGISPEVLCAYDDSKINDTPSLWSYAFSRFYKLKAYYRCYSIEAIKTAVNKGKRVTLGVKVYSSIFNSPGDIEQAGAPAGGHAILVYGFDDNHINPDGTKGAFRIENSWGTRWGKSGYGWIGYDYVRNNFIEAWAIDL